MKLRDDDLADLNEFEEQSLDTRPDQPEEADESQPTARDNSNEAPDDTRPDTSATASQTTQNDFWNESNDWPSKPEEETDNGVSVDPAPPEGQTAPEERSAGPRLPVRVIKIGVVALLILAILGCGIVAWHYEAQHSRQNDQVVRHPVPHHLYKQQFDFFILATSTQGEAFVKLGLVFEFYALNAYQQFQHQSLAKKDLVFDFLQQAHPRANTEDQWQPIVQKNLLAYFNKRSPHNGIESIRITYLDEL